MENSEKQPKQQQPEASRAETLRGLINGDVQPHRKFADYVDFAVWCIIIIAVAMLLYFTLSRFVVIKKFVSKTVSVLGPVIVGFVLAYLLDPVVSFIEKWYMRAYNKIQERRESRKEKDKVFISDNVIVVTPKQQDKLDKKAEREERLRQAREEANPALVRGQRGARTFSILITVVVTLTLVIYLIGTTIPQFIDSVVGVATKMPDYIDKADGYITTFLKNHKRLAKQIPDSDQILKVINLEKRLQPLATAFLEKATSWIVVAVKVVYNVLVGLIVAVYLLAGKERYIGQMKKLTFAIMKPQTAKLFVQNMHQTNGIFKSAILGKILDSILIGIICYIGMTIMGLFGLDTIFAEKTLISVIIGVTNVIPFFGPYIGAIPSIFLVLCEDHIEALILAIFILVLQQFDANYLTPKIVGKSVGLSPFYVLVACLVGGGFFGVIGMLLAIPTGAVIYGFIKTGFESKLEAKQLPTDTKEYVLKTGKTILDESVWDDDPSDNGVEVVLDNADDFVEAVAGVADVMFDSAGDDDEEKE